MCARELQYSTEASGLRLPLYLLSIQRHRSSPARPRSDTRLVLRATSDPSDPRTREAMMRSHRIVALLSFASVWSSRWTLVRSFPLDLFELALDTTSHAEFENDEHAFRFAVKWQTVRISSSSSTAAPFVGCTDYTEGRRARIRLERMFGLDAVRTVHHSREHRSSCFVFHARHEEARELLKEPGMTGGVQLQYVAAFPANLKVYRGAP